MSTKIHALCDGLGRPFAFVLSGGQACDLIGFEALIGKVEASLLIGDKGYDADERVRRVLAVLNKRGVIPPRKKRKHPVDWTQDDANWYKKRHQIENVFGRLKDSRAIATRYDKLARNFLSGVFLVASLLWLN